MSDMSYDIALGCNDYYIDKNKHYVVNKQLFNYLPYGMGTIFYVWIIDDDKPYRIFKVVEVTDSYIIADCIKTFKR